MVLTGAPTKDATKITLAEEDWLTNPSRLLIGKIRRPTVLMIPQPPNAVPTVMATDAPMTTGSGATRLVALPLAKSRPATIPTVFWASFEPWLKASQAEEAHWTLLTGPRRRADAAGCPEEDPLEDEGDGEPRQVATTSPTRTPRTP